MYLGTNVMQTICKFKKKKNRFKNLGIHFIYQKVTELEKLKYFLCMLLSNIVCNNHLFYLEIRQCQISDIEKTY